MRVVRALALALFLAPPLAAAAPAIEVVGLDGRSRVVSLDDLERLGPREVTVPDPHTKAPSRYRGVPLTSVLGLAGLSFDAPLRGPLLSAQLRVEAADGYRVAFSLPELDPRTGSTEALLAFQLDGNPLGEELGPLRVVVPTDKRGARWARQVTRLVLIP
jgi:hypothetical protein